MTITTTETKTSIAAILAQYTGNLSDWVNILPSKESAQAALDALPPEERARLLDRAARHGMEGVDLMQKTPEVLWDDPESLGKFMDMMDVSHIKSVKYHPELAEDPSNVIWEVSSDNSARGASTMSGAEYSEATSNTRKVARDITGDTSWWDMNDIFKSCLDAAALLGYSAAWIPKDIWIKMMNTIRYDFPLIDKETTFSGKYKIARAFALKIQRFFKAHGHHTAAAFMLGLLTMFWPPAAFFVATWAMTGVLGMAVHLFRTVSQKASKKYRFFRFLAHIDVHLAKFEWVLNQCRSFLDHIRTGIYKMATKVADLFFGFATQVYKKVVVPAVQAVIKTAKNLLFGFLQWAFGGSAFPAVA